ncbi:MAG: AAA family ATPase [Deltaproteobacteria bacterium]|jgi:chromosome partitioning protein|nr:AAA family ATPase [Deltaproteobacteria bacterium]MBW2500977.1 AAA family ATPase [Deltaproteobacteria bacterium]
MRVIAIVNQKGGCGKTTTVVNLAGALAADGNQVLVVDMDPQAHATLALGLEPDDLEVNLYEVLVEPSGAARLDSVIVDVSDHVDIAPSSIVLSALEQKLATERHDARTERLAAAIDTLSPLYDFVLIDCPPNVGLLTFNALRAASEVIVPLETSFFAIDGVQKLLETIGLLADRIGHDLHVRVLPTLYDGRTRYARQTLGEIRELFKDLCFDSVIRLNVKLREAARQGRPISLYAPSANGALDYASVAMELIASPPDRWSQPAAEEEPADEADAIPREVVVRFEDASAGDVRIAGDFNGWVPDRGVRSLIASEGPTRVWTKILTLEPGTYQYRYVVDGEWREDPANPRSAPGPTGQPNSILQVR